MNVITQTARRKEGPAPAAAPRKGLSMKKVDRYLRYVLFLTAIGALFIWNAHQAEKKIQRRETLKREVRELRVAYHVKEADLNASVRYAAVAAATDTLGLVRPDKPPFRLEKAQPAEPQK